ncbi:hypothetical protein, partial [Shewanella sairae]|uniref:hypothetical protein n=1 Tax=Shewanella sairae TaxID=190310 RepID=UPI001C802440
MYVSKRQFIMPAALVTSLSVPVALIQGVSLWGFIFAVIASITIFSASFYYRKISFATGYSLILIPASCLLLTYLSWPLSPLLIIESALTPEIDGQLRDLMQSAQALLTEQDIKNQGNRINALVDFILFSQTNFLLMAGFAFIINT